MRKIEAYVRPHVLEDIRVALTDAGIKGLSVIEVRGFGQQKGHTEFYRGAEYQVDFVNKVKIETVVADDICDAAVEAIMKAGRTGKVGDGKIFISGMDDAIRIRTGESGPDVL
jgi:nitrogen regulatory protein P-II 1